MFLENPALRGQLAVTLDGLDIPLIRMLDASFAERMDEETRAVTRPEGDARTRYGHNLLPVNWEPTTKTSRSFIIRASAAARRSTTWRGPARCTPRTASSCNTSTRPAAATRRRRSAPSSSTCRRVSPGPASGSPTARSITSSKAEAARASANGRSTGSPRDIFVAPSWLPVVHEAEEDAVLFSYSDRPVQKALGLWRSSAA